LTPLWETDLKGLLFLKPLFGNPTRSKLKTLFREAGGFKPESGSREFACAAVKTASELLGTQTFSKYKMDRAFDEFDFMFGMRYRDDDGMQSQSSLRLYEGGGVGVQTSYASLLLLLKHLNMRNGARIADLGCGFGRLGLLCGVWRADLVFFGYEYAGHRLFGAREASVRLGIDSRIQFYEQDLGAEGFQLPQADVFYLYDPFTSNVYEKVLRGLMHAAKYRSITVVTKGLAGGRFGLAATGWSAPEYIDAGGLSIFRSPAPRARDRVDGLNPNER
jgi:SAM-dependent methyltransferase